MDPFPLSNSKANKVKAGKLKLESLFGLQRWEYESTQQIDPVEKRGISGDYWIWEYPDYTKSYMVVADVARGDGQDFSTFHVFDVEGANQVAEFKSKVPPKEFGNLLVGVTSEYNNALLVVENANIGWSTIEQIIEREYDNMYYSSKSD